MAVHRHHPGKGLHDGVVAGRGSPRAVCAEGADVADEDVGCELADVLLAEPEPLHHAGPEALHDDVAADQQSLDQLASLGALEVGDDAALAGVGPLEDETLVVEERAEAVGVVTDGCGRP